MKKIKDLLKNKVVVALTVVIVMTIIFFVTRKIKLDKDLKEVTKDNPALAIRSYLKRAGLPAPIQNNNPGALKRSITLWNGEIISFEPIKKFSLFIWGVRALILQIKSAIERGDTFKTMAADYQLPIPPIFEANPDDFIKSQATAAGVDYDKQLVADYETVKRIAQNFADNINGKPPGAQRNVFTTWIPDNLMKAAWDLQ